MAGWGRTWVPAAVVAALVLAGCGGGDDAGEATRAPGVGEVGEQPGGTEGDAAADVDTGDTGGADGAAGSAGAPTAEVVLAATAGREVIRTAEVVVEVDDLAGATDRATALVTAAGGYLESGRASDDGGWPSTRAVYRVPPDAFDRLLGDLADLGDEIDRRVELDDVTGTVVDLRGRRLAVEASVARLRELFDDAGDVGAVVAVESELVRREAELESLTGQLRALEQRVALATVTLTLEERTEPVLAATGPVQALGDGARAFAATVGVVLVALAWSAPFLAALAVLVALAVVVRRWLRRTPVTPTTSEPAPADG